MSTIISQRFACRRRTEANWASLNEVLLVGEIGVVTDSGHPYPFKIGDGATAWLSLPYATPCRADASGTNTLTATADPVPVLFDRMEIALCAAAANTGAVTLNLNSLGAIAVTKQGGTALAAGDIVGAGHELILRYRASVPRWELLNPGTATADVASAIHGATAKTTPVDADEFGLADSAASWALKRLSWANLKAGMWTAWGALIAAGTSKSTPVDGDSVALCDSAASNATKKVTWANVKATLKAYFDTLYASAGSAEFTYTAPAFSNVISLLHFDGANNSTTITDQIGANGWTVNGNAAIKTAESVFGGSSLLVPSGSFSCIKTNINSGWDFGAGDWAIEFRWKYSGAPDSNARILQTRDGDVFSGLGIYVDASGNMQVSLGSTGTSFNLLSETCGPLSQSAWNDVIVQCINSVVYAFVNRELRLRKAITRASLHYNSGYRVVLGGQTLTTSRAMNAYIDEFRACKGCGVMYPVATHVAPSSAFPDS